MSTKLARQSVELSIVRHCEEQREFHTQQARVMESRRDSKIKDAFPVGCRVEATTSNGDKAKAIVTGHRGDGCVYLVRLGRTDVDSWHYTKISRITGGAA